MASDMVPIGVTIGLLVSREGRAMLTVESYEATRCKDGRLVVTFDAPDSFRPSGKLISATVNGQAVLVLSWDNGTTARLPDVRGKLAAIVGSAPTICVRWFSDNLLRGSDLDLAANHGVVR